MRYVTLEEVIRQHVHLPAHANHHGWYSVLCKVCNDHGRKGKRGGFRFDDGQVGYNCFNCGHTALFDPTKHHSMPNDMITVLDAFGIPKDDWQPVLLSALVDEFVPSKQRKEKISKLEPTEIELPPYFTPLVDDEDEINQYAIEYLKNERMIDWKDYPFYVGRKTDNPSSKRWYARLIIPVYKDKKLVFYQGRDLTGLRQKKYLSPDISRENVIYGYERIFENTDNPLYIVEGWFDAYHLNGVAVFGSRMTQNQIKWINQSRRPKVVIPDRYGSGFLLAEQALELGWSISTPDIGDCKDPNEAIMTYGKIYTLMTILNNTSNGIQAQVKLNLYCVRDTKK